MELDHVEAFVAIVRRGGFTRASAVLHLSQPAISRRIHSPGAGAGGAALRADPDGHHPDRGWPAFLPHAEALLASMRDGVEAVGALRGADRGTVTLAVVGTLASPPLSDRLRQFREAAPAVDLLIRTGLSVEVSALVRRGDATLGLRYQRDPDPDLVSEPVHQEAMVPVCGPGHRLAGARRVAPSALAGERWVAFPARPATAAPEAYSTALQERLAACGLGGAEVLPIDSLTAQKRMVEAGFGLALLPASSVDEEIRAGTLRVLAVPALRVTIPVVLVRRRRAFLSGAARVLASLLASWPSVGPEPRDGPGSRR